MGIYTSLARCGCVVEWTSYDLHCRYEIYLKKCWWHTILHFFWKLCGNKVSYIEFPRKN